MEISVEVFYDQILNLKCNTSIEFFSYVQEKQEYNLRMANRIMQLAPYREFLVTKLLKSLTIQIYLRGLNLEFINHCKSNFCPSVRALFMITRAPKQVMCIKTIILAFFLPIYLLS